VIAPADPDVKNLRHTRKIQDMHSLSVSVRGTRTKDSAGSSTGTVLDAQWMAPPIGLATRPFVRSYWEQAEVDAIHTEYQRLGVGLEHRIPRIGTLRAELQQEWYQKKESSLILGGNWLLNDFWQLNAQWDTNSVDVPLRARVDGVSGWKGQLGVRYRAHEGASTGFYYAEQGQTDTNRRRTAALDGNYTLLQRPGLKGILGLEWAASDNSLRNTPYFNPIRDQTVQFSWNTEWLQPMPLDRVFKQQLIVAAGWYAQQGFDAGAIGSISYQHDWRLSDVTDLRYGVAYIHRLFDGQVSQGPEANLNFNWRF
jgi:biofilm PGA synthesis protein PgaA